MLFTIPFLLLIPSIIVILAIVIIIIGYFYSFKIELKRYDVFNNEIKENKDVEKPYTNKIVFFSDLHLGRTMKMKKFVSILQKLDSLNANLYIFGGDFIGNQYRKYYNNEDVKKCLKSFFDKHECIAVEGNHEIKEKIDLKEFGFNLLKNEKYICNDINIYGLEDGYSDNLVIPSLDNSKKNILLIHEGDFFDKFEGNFLMLSGHTHGGQIRIPFIPIYYKPKYGKKYHSGLYIKENKNLIVSKGLGCNLIQMRLFAKCDIILLDMKG